MDLGTIIQICVIVFGIGAAWAAMSKKISDNGKEIKKINDYNFARKVYEEKQFSLLDNRCKERHKLNSDRLDSYDKLIFNKIMKNKEKEG